MMNSRTRTSFAALAVAALVACGGGSDGNGAPGTGEGGEAAPGEAAEGGSTAIPVSAPTGAVDEALAERGEDLFKQKGCVGCHTFGKGRLTGPDFTTVESWRDFEWFYHMVSNPDSMTRNDPQAKQLLQEYMTPMPDLNVQPDEVRALYEYLRHETGEEGAESEP